MTGPEFVAGGTFELSQRNAGAGLRARIIVCADGRSGHHFRTREETARLRRAPSRRASAAIGRYEFELLLKPNGNVFRRGVSRQATDLLAPALAGDSPHST